GNAAPCAAGRATSPSPTHALRTPIAGRAARPATGGAPNATLRDVPDDSLRLLDSEAPQRLAAYIAQGARLEPRCRYGLIRPLHDGYHIVASGRVVNTFHRNPHLLGHRLERTVAIRRVFDVADALVGEFQQADVGRHDLPLLGECAEFVRAVCGVQDRPDRISMRAGGRRGQRHTVGARAPCCSRSRPGCERNCRSLRRLREEPTSYPVRNYRADPRVACGLGLGLESAEQTEV